jgi:hypothetical protein
MTSSTKLDEKLEGVDNFRAWKYRVMLILEENDLEGFVKEEVPEPDTRRTWLGQRRLSQILSRIT